MKHTKKEIELLERQSLENLVDFYRHELLQIMRGRSGHEVLPDGVRKRLLKNGIIIRGFSGRIDDRSLGSPYSITPLGEEMLGGDDL